MINIIKIGGNIVDNEEALNAFLTDFAAINENCILVHGGGKIATQVSKGLGIETQMINGRRVTDQETLKVVTMVYAGLVNKTIVSLLQSKGSNSIGLSGADANLIKSHKRINTTTDYGFVGDVDEVNAPFLQDLVNKGLQPVIAPITHDQKGQLLNTNADTIASTVAVALSADNDVRLIYCFELPGVMKDINNPDSIIEEINVDYYHQLKSEGVIAAGMIPKMDNCFDAIAKGVKEVRICHAKDIKEVISSGSKGTCLN